MLMAFLDLEINLVIKGTCIFVIMVIHHLVAIMAITLVITFVAMAIEQKEMVVTSLSSIEIGSWSSNTTNRPNMVLECHMCLRKGQTTVTCLYHNDNTQVSQECQICSKREYIAIDCRHWGNYAYQETPHPLTLSANYDFQDYSYQFQYPGSQSSLQMFDNSRYQGVIFNFQQCSPGFLASMNQGQSSLIFLIIKHISCNLL